jgi:long-chain fatty acid transport protein
MNRPFLYRLAWGCLVVTSLASSAAHATNGMALSGYGPIAMAMGGAAVAYDSGNSGAINNPATLALMPQGARFEVDVNMMHVDAETWMSGVGSASSEAEWFAMPSISYIVKSGRVSYGLGVFSQGGMGANYGKKSFLSADPVSGEPTGLPDESEVMIGRLILPWALEVNDRLSIGASFDAVYGRMTMKQLVSRQGLFDMVLPGRQTLGVATFDLAAIVGLGPTALRLAGANYAHFDLDKLDGWGVGGQVGLVFRASDTLAFGASYQFETHLEDLEADDASIHAGRGSNFVGIPGSAAIEDFQWPATIKVGAAWQATERLLLVADIKHYRWSDVLDSLKIRFEPDTGGTINIEMYQEWDDQTVFSIGGEYRLTPRVRLRAGFNYGKDPVPENYLQHLAEAITEKHLMLGAGVRVGKRGQFDLAYVHAFEAEETNTNPLIGLTSSMSQDSVNLSYSHRF